MYKILSNMDLLYLTLSQFNSKGCFFFSKETNSSWQRANFRKDIRKEYAVNLSKIIWRDDVDDHIDCIHPDVPWIQCHREHLPQRRHVPAFDTRQRQILLFSVSRHQEARPVQSGHHKLQTLLSGRFRLWGRINCEQIDDH